MFLFLRFVALLGHWFRLRCLDDSWFQLLLFLHFFADRVIDRGWLDNLEHDHEFVFSAEVHPGRVDQFDHLWRVGDLDHLLDLFPD